MRTGLAVVIICIKEFDFLRMTILLVSTALIKWQRMLSNNFYVKGDFQLCKKYLCFVKHGRFLFCKLVLF
jgi:hypothetical protein